MDLRVFFFIRYSRLEVLSVFTHGTCRPDEKNEFSPFVFSVHLFLPSLCIRSVSSHLRNFHIRSNSFGEERNQNDISTARTCYSLSTFKFKPFLCNLILYKIFAFCSAIAFSVTFIVKMF